MSSSSYTVPVQIDIDYGQFYLYGDVTWRDSDDPPYLRAIDDAHSSGRRVGAADGLIVFLSPAQFHFGAPLTVEVWDAEPPLDQDLCEHVVDIDLDCPAGALYFEQAACPEQAQVVWLREPGRFRARLEGAGYTAQQETRLVEGGPDSYRAQLWPRAQERSATLQREWPGWNTFLNPAPTDGVAGESPSSET